MLISNHFTNQNTAQMPNIKHDPLPTIIKSIILALLFAGVLPAVQVACWLLIDWLIKIMYITPSMGIQTALNTIMTGVLIGFLSWLVRRHLPHLPSKTNITPSLIGRVLFAFLVCFALGEWLTVCFKLSPDDFMIELLIDTPIWLLWLSVCIIVPIYEELIFRGVLWRLCMHIFGGFRHYTIITSVLISLLFAVLHSQYQPIEQLLLFAISLVLCYARWQSGSLILPILLHIANNALAFVMLRW